jgi:glutathione S-transferase
MKLYGNPLSTCTRKVLTTFAEKGVEPEFVSIDFTKREQKSEQHVARQPFGVVPVLEDGSFQMYESRAIIRYLDRVLPGAKLTPEEPRSYARMEQWMSVEAAYFSPPAMKIVFQKMFHPMWGLPTDESIVEQSRAGVTHALSVLDRNLASGTFLAGDSFTLADICYLPYLEYLFACGEGALVHGQKNVAGWWERCSSRPSWRKAIGK